MTDPEPTREQVPAPAEPVRAVPAPAVVPRWIQLVLLPIGLLALYVLARAAGSVLLIFLVAGVVALILNPLVKLLERGRLPRAVAVFAVYIGMSAAIAGAGLALANPVSTQVESFQHDVPQLVRDANSSLADVQSWLDRTGINFQVKAPGQSALTTLERKVLHSSGSIVSFARDFVSQVVSTSFALVLVLVISIYMLIYAEGIGRLVRSALPAGDGTPADDYPVRVQKAVSGYVRGQLLFSLIMGVTAGIALWLFGVAGIFPDGRHYAFFFAVFFGFMELVPYVGPVLGALPPILVALFNDPLSALWVALLFLALQQLEGHIVAPQIFGHSLRINPLLIIFALLFGAETYGMVGALIALPIAAVARETVIYLRRHLVLEPWSGPPLGGLGPPLAADAAPPPATCPACRTAVAAADAYCRGCGTELRQTAELPG